MKKKWIAIIAVSLAVVLGVTLALVFGRKEEQEIVDADGVTVKGNQVYYLDPAVEGDSIENKERIKITFAETGFGRTWIVNASKKFVKANPEYWIYLDGDPEITTSFANKLETGAAIADIYMPLASNWFDCAVRGWIEPLDDVFAARPDGEESPSIEEKLSDSFTDYCKATVGGETKYYVMPWNENVTGIVYNGALFEQYGWKVPTTVDGLLALCDQIIRDTQGSVAPFVYPGSVGGYFDFLTMNWWLQAGGVEKVQEFFDFGSAEVYQYESKDAPSYGKFVGLTQFSKLFGNTAGCEIEVDGQVQKVSYTLNGSPSKDHTQAQQSFLKGEAAMIPNGGWMECEMATSLPEGFTMRMMRTPYMTGISKQADGEYLSYNYSAQPDYMLIPTKAQNKDGAKKFLAFLCSDEMLQQYTVDTGSARPFDYEITGIETMTAFTKDCLDIWQNSDYSYFESSKSPLWLNNKVKTFNTVSPYTKIRTNEMTARVFCGNEYTYAKDNWAKWLSELD